MVEALVVGVGWGEGWVRRELVREGWRGGLVVGVFCELGPGVTAWGEGSHGGEGGEKPRAKVGSF